MIARAFHFVLLFLLLTPVSAQEIRVQASKNSVQIGETVQLNYELDNLSGRVQLPVTPGFRQNGSQQSTHIANGRYSQRITLFLQAIEVGNHAIGPLYVQAGNQRYASEIINIEVKSSGSAPAQSGSSNQARQQQQISGDLMLVTELGKKKVYLGEAVSITAHLYTQYNSISFDHVEFPQIEGGLVREIPDAVDNSFRRTQYQGRIYNHAILKKWMLIPQRTGELNISSVKAGVRVAKPAQATNEWDFFFGPRYVEQKMDIESAFSRIQVLPLPEENKPESFLNAVGQFEFTASIDKTKLEVNDAITLTFTVSGTGNLPVLEMPQFEMPSQFETTAPAIREKSKITENGYSGSILAEYILIAGQPGKFTIPSFSFAFFNPKTGKYEVKKTDPYEIVVFGDAVVTESHPAASSGAQTLDKDIRYIQTEWLPTGNNSGFARSLLYFALLVIFLILPIAVINLRNSKILAGKSREENESGKALKTAKKLLHTAGKHLENGETKPALKALLEALSDYLTHRHKLPPVKQTWNEMLTWMQQKQRLDLFEKYQEIRQQAEFSLYSPVTETQTRAIVEKAMQWIVEMEKIRV